MPLLDAIDIEILMHRDAHFGGNFDIMLEYYENDGIGVMYDFDIKRIKELKEIQNKIGENLALKFLSESAIERIVESQNVYKKLRDSYSAPSNRTLALISDLILSEEEEPEKEMAELIANASESYKPLIRLIDSDNFYDPLFPGYGRSPMFVAICLSEIGNPDAIPHLFNAIGREDFEIDEEIIFALISFGSAAKDFLLKRLITKPFSKDNEYAAIALSTFPLDEEIAIFSLGILFKEDALMQESLFPYLIYACEGLKKTEDRQIFCNLLKKEGLNDFLKNEMKSIIKSW